MSSGLWSVIGRLTSIFALLVNYRLICEILTPEDLSLYVSVGGLSTLGVLVSGGAVSVVTLRYFTHGEMSSSGLNRVSILYKVVSLSLMLSLFECIGLWILIQNRPMFFGRPLESVFALVAAWIGMRSICMIFAEGIKALQQFSLSSMIGGLQEGVLVNLGLMCTLYLWGGRISSIGDLLFIQVTLTGVACAAGFVILVPRVFKSDRGLSKTAGMTQLGCESGKVLVNGLVGNGIVEYETLLIGRYCDDNSIGAWGGVKRLVQVIKAPLLLANAALPSFIAELYSRKEMKKLEDLLRGVSTVALPIGLLVLVGLALFGDRILAFFHSDFSPGYYPLVIMAVANVAFIAGGSAGLTLSMTNKQGVFTLVSVSIAAIYVVTAPALIRSEGLLGAASAGAVLVIVRNIAATILVKKLIGVWCSPIWRPSELRASIGVLSKAVQRKLNRRI